MKKFKMILRLFLWFVFSQLEGSIVLSLTGKKTDWE